jgi:hypothetical protein
VIIARILIKALEKHLISQMPTYPIFQCKVCDSAVQLESAASKNAFPMCGFGRQVQFSCQLDSDDYSKNCRGQGRFYASVPSSPYASPVDQNHFNYSGSFAGMCCYCAFGSGLCRESFEEVGCYQCKRRYQAVREFSKLKVQKTEEGEQTSWESSGWGGLSDSLVDLILHMVVGEKAKLVGE